VVDTNSKLKFLQTLGTETPQAPARLARSIETHMSWVFLAGDEVFKLKKPVRFPFLDFTSLQAREFYCREEIRLNERLAPGIYRGLMVLQWHAGAFSLVPENYLCQPGFNPVDTVDWLVCMKRLPQDSMLDHQIAQQRLQAWQVDALADVLVKFYQIAQPVPVSPEDYLARFQCEQASNREVLLRPQFQLRDAGLAIEQLDADLVAGAELLRGRARAGRVLDGHGDLRPEHVCLLHPPVVIDCLEFNPQLRQVDPFDELAYLSLECTKAGAAWVGARLIATCAQRLNDHPAPALLHLYTAHRALLRARLCMAHLLDDAPRSPEKWPTLATRYIELALAALGSFKACGVNAPSQHGWPK
jgi:uncharacterized protein